MKFKRVMHYEVIIINLGTLYLRLGINMQHKVRVCLFISFLFISLEESSE